MGSSSRPASAHLDPSVVALPTLSAHASVAAKHEPSAPVTQSTPLMGSEGSQHPRSDATVSVRSNSSPSTGNGEVSKSASGTGVDADGAAGSVDLTWREKVVSRLRRSSSLSSLIGASRGDGATSSGQGGGVQLASGIGNRPADGGAATEAGSGREEQGKIRGLGPLQRLRRLSFGGLSSSGRTASMSSLPAAVGGGQGRRASEGGQPNRGDSTSGVLETDILRSAEIMSRLPAWEKQVSIRLRFDADCHVADLRVVSPPIVLLQM
jgi:hypothetical protein